jgi:hypothetical protein
MIYKHFHIVSELFHAIQNNRFSITNDIFRYRELHMVRHPENEELTRHSVSLFVTEMFKDVSDYPSFPMIEAVLQFVQHHNLQLIEELYHKERILHITLIVPLLEFSKKSTIRLSNGDMLEGGQHGIIFNNEEAYYPEKFTELVHLLWQRLHLSHGSWLIPHISKFLHYSTSTTHNLVSLTNQFIYLFIHV